MVCAVHFAGICMLNPPPPPKKSHDLMPNATFSAE